MSRSNFFNNAVKVFEVSALAMCLTACGCGREEAAQTKDAQTTVAVAEPTEQAEQEKVPTEQSSSAEENQQPTGHVEGEGGGNDSNNDGEAVVYKYDVLISEAEYYYDNAPISLDDLIDVVKEGEGEKLVIISDNNATQNAYEELTQRLTELEIPFEEK